MVGEMSTIRRSGPRRWFVPFAATAVLLLVALTACGSGERSAASGSSDSAGTAQAAPAGSGRPSSTVDTDTPTVGPGPAVPSRGCAAGPTSAVQLERRTVPVAELSRWYLLTVPEASDPQVPFPLVLDFHGLTEGADVHAQLTGMGAYGASHGFVAVIPQGTGDLARWAAGPGGSAGEPNIDVDFVNAMLDQVEDSICIDTSRVYATGMSNGAMLTSMLGCRLAGRLAAVAPISGATTFDSCEPVATVPMMTIHGTADPILLFNGGVGDLVKALSGSIGGDGSAPSSGPSTTAPAPTTTVAVDLDGPGYPANVAAWAQRNGCGPTPSDEPVSATVTHRTYDCPAGADVEMYVVAGGGHAWPGSELSQALEGLVGTTTFDIDATDLVWAFFQRFRRG